MAKHRAPRYVRTKKVIAKAPVAAGATAIGLGVLSTSPANASTTHDWSGVANCESSGNWSTNTGNGYYGGLQFSPSTWAGYGGTAFAPRADLATPAQQVQIAEKVLAGQGRGAWPTCGKYLTGGSTATAAAHAAATSSLAASAPATTTTGRGDGDGDQDDAVGSGHVAPAGHYTVARGDTVAKIAAAHGEAWRALYQRNVGIIGANPNLIFPGQVLALTGTAQGAAPPASSPSTAPTASTAVTTVRTTAAAAAVPAPAAAPAPAPAAPAAQAPAVQAPAASSVGAVAEKAALAQLGTPYVYGGASPGGFDCSGLVQYAYKMAGVDLPRTSGAQMSMGTPVSEADLQVGDLVFFYGGTHVGIYIGNGEVVHAPVPGQTVTTIKIAYMPYTTARRIS